MFFDRGDFYLTKEEQLKQGELFWKSLQEDDIEERLEAAVIALIPDVMEGPHGREKLDKVVGKVRETLGCVLPCRSERMIGSLKPNHDGLVQAWMCPAVDLCGKSGSSATGCYCKDIDHTVMNGILCNININQRFNLLRIRRCKSLSTSSGTVAVCFLRIRKSLCNVTINHHLIMVSTRLRQTRSSSSSLRCSYLR